MDVRRLRSALQRTLGRLLVGDQEMVTRWVCVVESIDERGVRGVWIIPQRGSMPWDLLGLLDYAIETEKINMIRDEGNR
jgi:hypothetical protein